MMEPENTASPGPRVGGQRLTGQRRLVDLNRVPLEQSRVGGDDVTQAQPDDVARDELSRRGIDPLAVAQHTGLDRELGLQGVDGLAGLVLFPEPDAGVGEQQDQNDDEVGPVAQTADRITATSIIQGIGPQK